MLDYTVMHTLPISLVVCYASSGVTRISFWGVGQFFWKSGGICMARGFATRMLGGFGGMLRRENFKKWCNLVRFREYFAKILSIKIL